MNVTKLRQVFLVPSDLDAQIRFVEDTLGLEMQFRDGNRWIQYAAGSTSVALADPSEGLGAPLDTPVPVFEVEDLDGCVVELRESGSTVGEVRDMGDHGRTVSACDPSGAFLVFFAKV